MIQKFLPEICKLYNIDDIIARDLYVYFGTKTGMYDMKQAAIISYTQLLKHMDGPGYYPIL